MPRDLRHFILNNLGTEQKFKPRSGGSKKRPSSVPNRATHAQTILHALDLLPALEHSPGLYLEIRGRPGEIMVGSGLDASGLELLKIEQVLLGSNDVPSATIFASPSGLKNLRRKIEDFKDKDTVKRDGSIGRPKNADLAQSINAIVEAGLRALWRSPQDRFPKDRDQTTWEIWLDPKYADEFVQIARRLNIEIRADRLTFPEDVVVMADAAPDHLALAIRQSIGVRALAAPTTAPDFFDDLEIEEQIDWVQNLMERTNFIYNTDPSYITLLDTGIARAHPLIQPALHSNDRHAANPAWGLEDVHGHGTQLAGLALYGDLHGPLQSGLPINISHRLEAAKILPDTHANPHHLLGAITRQGVDAAETTGERRRVFTLAATTDADTPHDGAPTSWSSQVDQLLSGVSGQRKIARLMVISAGNTDQNLFDNHNYLEVCDDQKNEIESPAQAWNAICIGAYTEKTDLPAGEVGVPIAPAGDLSPASRTASWSSHWPIKPDIVLEGGNWISSNPPPPMRHQATSMLTTAHNFPHRAFTTCHDTSAATALAARALSEVWADYPELWPETIRALFVSSARWTNQMKSHLPSAPTKADYANLFRRYGYGVPNIQRARRSASNSLCLIVQDSIKPYRKSDAKNSPHVHNEMKLFSLPWPTQALRELGNTSVTLRVTLCTMIYPNPSEPSRGSKFGYASHNLRFKLKRTNETDVQFLARINAAAEQPDEVATSENDGWTFGRNRRDVGSLHIDQLTCPASDLARRGALVVHPVTGWWKTQKQFDPTERSVRFSMIVEIDAGETDAQLYTEVAEMIGVKVAVVVET